jgi:hypothetical protein
MNSSAPSVSSAKSEEVRQLRVSQNRIDLVWRSGCCWRWPSEVLEASRLDSSNCCVVVLCVHGDIITATDMWIRRYSSCIRLDDFLKTLLFPENFNG